MIAGGEEKEERKVLDESTSESENPPVALKTGKKIKKMTKKQQLDHQANKAHLLLDWRHRLPPIVPPLSASYQCVPYQESLAEVSLDALTHDVQGIFLNVSWEAPQETLRLLREVSISDRLVRNGIVFVWAEKEYIADVMTEMENKRFVYIENF